MMTHYQYTAACSWRIARSGRSAADLAIPCELLRSTDYKLPGKE